MLQSSAVADVMERLPFVSLMRVFLHLYGWWTQGAGDGFHQGGVIDCVSVSDIYSKAFMHLILQDGNNTLLELDTDVLSCFDRNIVNSTNNVCIRVYVCPCPENSARENSGEIIIFSQLSCVIICWTVKYQKV